MGDIHALDRALDELLAGGSADVGPGVSALVEVARELRAGLPAEMRAEASARHLEMLADVGLARVPAKRSLVRRAGLVALAAAVALTLLGSSALAASSSAAPGDSLYGVKRAFEKVGFVLHRSEQSRAQYAFEIVQRRLAELQAARTTRARERARAEYERALAKADHILGKQADVNDSLLDLVQAELENHVAVLNALLDQVPDEARAGIQHALDNASKAEEHAARGRGKHQPATPPARPTPGRAGRSSRLQR